MNAHIAIIVFEEVTIFFESELLWKALQKRVETLYNIYDTKRVNSFAYAAILP